MKSDHNKLGRLLHQLRTEQNMSLRDFAKQVDISHAYLNKLEKGVDSRTGKPIAPTIDVLLKIASNINVSAEMFLRKCGYFDTQNLSLNEPVRVGEVDIMESLEDLKFKLSAARCVVSDGKVLNDFEVTHVIIRLDSFIKTLLDTDLS